MQRLALPFALLLVLGPEALSQPCTPEPTLQRRGPLDDTSAWPRDLRHPAACFDPVDGVVLLVGMSPAGDRTDLWEWNGFRWRQRRPQDGVTPPPLADFAATFHEATGRLLVFGGTLPSGEASNRTWLWNGAFWDEPAFQDTPPAPRHAASIAYVPSMESAVLFGGIVDGATVAETWTWGLGGWRQRADGPLPPVDRHAFAAFPPRQAAVALVAAPTSDAFRGIWLFSAQGWQRVSELAPPVSDLDAESPLAFDPRSLAMVRLTHGGESTRTQRWVWSGDDELWLFDRWMVPSIPPRLFDLATTTDTRRDRIVILGRRTPDAPLELWEHAFAPDAPTTSAPELSYGSNCNATLLAAGDGPLAFQWLRDGAPIDDDDTFEGTQSPSLAIDGRRARCSRFALSCRVCAACGCVESVAVEFDFPFLADFNIDGGIDGADIEAFMIAWEASEPAADANCDGGIDGSDVESFFRCWESGCG